MPPPLAALARLVAGSILIPSTHVIDWGAGSTFNDSISTGTTYTFADVVDGQSIFVVVTASGSNAVTWPTVTWPLGAAPTQTAGGTDIYEFVSINGVIYGTRATTGTSAPSDLESCGLRLTGSTGVPVPTGDVTNITTLYFTPYLSGNIALYNTATSAWVSYSTAEISIALGTLTSGKAYDVFAYGSAGVVALELSAAWTSASARFDALAQQNGVWVKSSDHSRRYVGTIYTSSTTQTQDTAAQRFVWNLYNQKRRTLSRTDSTASWSFASNGTWHQANASASNKVECVIGIAGANVDISAFELMSGSATNDGVGVAIGEDSTTVPDASCWGMINVSESSSVVNAVTARMAKEPAIGYHAYNWLEACDHTLTSVGSRAAGANTTQINVGLLGTVEG